MLKPTSWILVSSILMTACGGSSSSSTSSEVKPPEFLPAQITEATDTIIVPAFTSLNTKALALKTSVDALCDTPEIAELEAAQENWKQLSSQWNRVALYALGKELAHIGPLNDDRFESKESRIDASIENNGDDKSGSVRSQLIQAMAASDDLTATNYFANLPALHNGLFPAEFLLFEDLSSQASTNNAQILTAFTDQPRRCQYLTGLVAELNVSTDAVEKGWTESYRDTGKSFQQIFKAEEKLANDNEPVVELIASLQSYLNYYKDKKIGGSEGNYQLVGAELSDNFYTDAKATVQELELLLTGQPGAEDGFFAKMIELGANQDVELIIENLTNLKKAIDAQNLTDMDFYFGKLDGNMKRELAQGLGISLGLSFADGD